MNDGPPIFRTPTPLEAAFLKTIVHGYADLEAQLPACKIADYDPTGWCEVRIGAHSRDEEPFNERDGPTILVEDETGTKYLIEILLQTSSGFLKTIEVIEYGCHLESPYEAFVAAAADHTVTYRYPTT